MVQRTINKSNKKIKHKNIKKLFKDYEDGKKPESQEERLWRKERGVFIK